MIFFQLNTARIRQLPVYALFFILIFWGSHNALAIDADDFAKIKEELRGNTATPVAASSDIASTASYLAVEVKSTGASLDMAATSHLHAYDICSYSADKSGEVFIAIGYKRRF